MKNLYKKGVSLIAVLLFMLVATIAATATFKWLSSEGLSSGSRMMQKEAYQSAVAGLENTRTWMTYHANDVGSLIKQYKDGENTPIKINSQLRELTRAGQNYDVWLVGVNTEESTYKLKFLSSGRARNGSVHSEVGIFNVDGLYQVNIPSRKVSATVDFEEAFFGDLATAGDINVNSAIISQTPATKNAGGQALNTINVSDYLILDGNFYVNSEANIKDLYITGDLGLCKDLNVSNNLYVRGVMYAPMPGGITVNGSAYLNGGVNLNKKSPLAEKNGGCSGTLGANINITGNTTMNGPLVYWDNNTSWTFHMYSSLVLNSYIDFPDKYGASVDRVIVDHNVYIGESSNGTGHIGSDKTGTDTYYDWSRGYAANPTDYEFSYSDGYNYFGKTAFGSSTNDKLYLNNFTPKRYRNGNASDTIHLNPWCSNQYNKNKCSDFTAYCNQGSTENFVTYNTGYNCYVTPDRKGWVGGKGTLLTTPPSAADLELWGADPMTDYGDKLAKKNACGNVKEPIQFNKSILNSSFIHTKDKPLDCDTKIFESWQSSWGSLVNSCYNIAKSKKQLYNDEWLIVETANIDMMSSMSAAITNKVIWIHDPGSHFVYSLPPTSGDGQVFLYLPNGVSQKNMAISSGKNYNYFIYSEGDVADFQMGTQLSGTIFMANCSRMNTNTSNAKLSASTDGTTIINDVASAAIICNNDGTNSCSAASSSTGEGGEESTTMEISWGAVDSYHIANAPQLSVSLESQYKANETAPATTESTDIEVDFIVVPRVIHMARDPYGELSDYYSVLPLNGLNFNRSNGTVSCSGSIPTSGALYNRKASNPTPLTDTYYTCSYTYNSKTVPFYVVVEGENGNAPTIAFKESSAGMGATDNHDVTVLVPPHEGTIALNFTKPADMDKWNFASASNVACSENKCTLNLDASSAPTTEVNLFSVTTSGASNGTAMFQLLSGEGYVIGTPSTMVLSVSSNVTVSRINVSESDRDAFCTSNPTLCPQNKSAWPDCPISSTSWVYAVGNNCTERTANMLWDCGIANDVSLQVSEDVPNWCVPIVPSYTHPAPLEANRTYELPAEIKAKPMKFLFGFSGSDISGKTIKASIATRSADMSCTYGSSISTTSSYCELEVFKGENVELSFPDGRPDNFNYWKCLGDNCAILGPQSGDTYSIVISEDNQKVLAYFDETDKHCFFDEFKLSSPSCSEGTSNYCFSTSTSGTKKWYINNEADLSKIDYNDGYVSAKMNKNDKNGITVMSTAVAGLIGNLRAQFQVPRITTSTAVIPETIQKSGFILRSNTILGNDYLLLSFYADNAGLLTANLCSKNGTCKTTTFSGAYIDDRNTVVTLTANLNTEGISLSALIGGFSSTSYSASIDFETEFSAYQNQGEYVGFRLADPNFKLFDIGWKSDDYGSECWDTYPTINCSFKVAYLGGIVPLKEEVEPWVGLSSWFDARGCSPKYYYKGEDACGGNNSSYTGCANNYIFDVKGKHGYTNGTVEYMTARAGVSGNECFSSLSSEDAALAEAEWAHCGTFWVGEMEECQNGIEFSRNGYYDGNALFTPPAPHETENLRLSTLKIELENTGNASVEIYLLSKLDDGSTTESKSFETTADGVATIDIAAISDADNFDPENVSGVVVKTEIGSIVTIKDVYTICPNEASVSCGNLAYNASSHKWEFSLDVTNYSRLANLKIWKLVGEDVDDEPSGIVTDECTGNHSDEGTGTCYPIVKSGEKVASYKSFGTNASFEVEDLPYKSPDTYVIAAQLTTDAGEVKGCKTNSVTIEPISRECSIDQSSVKQSAGIPQFHYSVSGCPSTTGCSYKIALLTEDGMRIGDKDIVNVTNSEGGNGATGGSEANVTTPLNEGKYKFRLESTDENLPFNPCEQSFDVETGVPATGTCSIDENKNTLSINVTGANNADDIPVTIIYNDAIGNVIGTYTVDIDGSLTDEINLKEKLSAGDYTIAMVINGANIPCGSYERIADLSLSCPNTELVAPTATFAPTVTGCEKGDCSWSISDGTTSNAATVSYSSGNISIANANPGTRYTITVTRGSDDDPKTCTVNFKSESNINATCTFDKSDYEWYESLSKVKITNPNSKDYNGMAYRFTWKAPGATAESQLASGNLGTNDNSIREISTSHLAQPGSYYVYLDGGSKPACTMTLASGSGLPTMRATNCTASSTSIPTSGTTKISATLTKCNGTSNCTWYIKKNGGSTPVKSGSYGDKVDQAEVSGPGTYTIHLLSADADASCTVEVTKASPANNCKFGSTSRNYGEDVQFQAKVTATSGTTYEIIDPNGNTVVSNSFTQNYNNQDWNYTFHAKVSGSYTLKIGGEEACSNASMTVSPAYLNNCKFDPTSVPEGNSSSFKFKINNCKNNECSFSLKKDGYVVSGDAYTKSSQPEGDYSLSSLTEAGNYVLWLNGEETDCSATLTVAAGGTLSCSFPSEAFAGDEGKIHIVSSRASGKYDAYIDGSIARDPWNNAKENFDISENGTVDVSFKIPSVGTHTWKITPHGSSTSLCDGSFNSTSDLKADCWFIYNNGGDTVRGTVAPETQLQFCIGPAIAKKEVSISGKKKGGDLSEKRWTETSQNSCVYFEAPSSSGSYPFSATYNSNEVCNTSQTLVVQAPPSVTSCSVSATSLTSTETATFSASVANVTSWSLKQDGTEIKHGGSTTSISETITGFGEYKLYLNGETTAKCTKTISEKTAGGEVTSIGTLTSFDERITAKNGECFKININSGSNGKLRCGHVWQNGSCSIKVTYGGNSTTMTDSYCNNDNGNPLSIGVMNSLDPDAVACVEITGASDTQCRVTNW
ncbi:MAG: hypothetical protein MJZ57_07755 [Bacteroidales bacterium]|nr:hypothetical protein [Bacteroidales bacterium]